MSTTGAPDTTDQCRELYRERAHLVAFLASLYPSVIANDDPQAPDWPVVYILTPSGQLSWHISPDDEDLFGHVPHPKAKPGKPILWDGHSTQQKYERLAQLARGTHCLRSRVVLLDSGHRLGDGVGEVDC
jgi:hypothetical protein